MPVVSRAAILKKVNHPKFDILRISGPDAGYIVMIYDDPDRNFFETESVYVMFLNSFPVEKWVEFAKEFIKKMEEKADERDERK